MRGNELLLVSTILGVLALGKRLECLREDSPIRLLPFRQVLISLVVLEAVFVVLYLLTR